MRSVSAEGELQRGVPTRSESPTWGLADGGSSPARQTSPCEETPLTGIVSSQRSPGAHSAAASSSGAQSSVSFGSGRQPPRVAQGPGSPASSASSGQHAPSEATEGTSADHQDPPADHQNLDESSEIADHLLQTNYRISGQVVAPHVAKVTENLLPSVIPTSPRASS